MESQKIKKQAIIRKVVISILLVVAVYFGGRKVVFSITHETTDNAQIETSIAVSYTHLTLPTSP
jgi:multidrug resistance efflux pump